MRFLLNFLLVMLAPAVMAEPVSEHEMKAVYLYNFAAHTDWPELNRANINFCTLGDEEVGLALTRFSGKRLHNQRIVIARLTSLVAIRQCQVLYVPARQAGNLPRIVEQLGDLPVMTVSDAPGAPVGVEMALEGNRLVFDINLARLQRVGLTPLPSMQGLARSVRGGH